MKCEPPDPFYSQKQERQGDPASSSHLLLLARPFSPHASLVMREEVNGSLPIQGQVTGDWAPWRCPHICTPHPPLRQKDTWAPSLVTCFLPSPQCCLQCLWENLSGGGGLVEKFYGINEMFWAHAIPWENIHLLDKYTSVVHPSILDTLRSLFELQDMYLYFLWGEGAYKIWL